MVSFRRMVALGGIILLATTGLAWGGAQEPIKIGSVLRLSQGAEHGIPARRGVELAVAMINEAGGINGRKVEVIFEDEKDSPTASVNAVQKLINVDQVVALIGPMTSGGILASGKTADDAKVVAVTPTATSPKVSGMGAYVFRACSRIDQQSKELTQYVAQAWKPKTVGILFSNEPYGKGCAELFGKDFEGLGIKVVAQESFLRGARDFKAQLTNIKAKNPDILFIPGYTQETAPAAAQARQLGMNQRILGVYGDMDEVYIQLAGKAAEGHVIASEYDERYKTKRNQEFTRRYYELAKQKGDPVNIMFAALTFDSTSMVLEGMRRNGPTSDGIRKFLTEVKDFDGVTGKLSFNEKNDVVRPSVYILEIKKGKWVKVK